MTRPLQLNTRPGLLVSVRCADEARAALAGGADVIDVKEPLHGSLGAASSATIAAVIRAVDGRAPVTAAAGELTDLCHAQQSPLPDGISLFKIGLAGCRTMPDWTAQWRSTVEALAPRKDAFEQTVAVVYADWLTAEAPDPQDILRLAMGARCPALLIDTFDKSAGTLFDIWPTASLRSYLDEVRSHDIMTVLAGSLTGDSIAAAARLMPDLIAVRTAACKAGRNSPVCSERVQSLRHAILNPIRTTVSATVPAFEA